MLRRDLFKSDKDTLGFVIRGLLIFLPVVILSGFGLYSLKMDRSLALSRATEEAETWLGRLAEKEIPSIFDLPFLYSVDLREGVPFPSFFIEDDPALAYRDKACAWLMNTRGELIYPARRIDFPNPVFGDDFDLWYQYRDAKHLLTQTNALKGAEVLEQVMRSDDPGLTPSGHHVAPLAALDWLAWNHSKVTTDSPHEQSKLHAWRVLGTEYLYYPSFFSTRLYEEAGAFFSVDNAGYAFLKKIADYHEKLRSLFKENTVVLKNVDWIQKGIVAKLDFDSDFILVSVPLSATTGLGSRWLIGWREIFVSNQLTQVLQENGSASYLKVSARIGGRWFPEPPGEERLVTATLPAFQGRPEMILQAWLAAPDLLYERQRQRTRVFGVMIGLASLTVLIGLGSEWKAFQRQKRLNEMKTNFVSSVSHELRTPLASVRLMAEELADLDNEAGSKIGIYHRTMVRECARLSGIIENVLNFSRIEKGTQQYTKSTSDLLNCLDQTVEMLRPYASEHRVTLHFNAQCSVAFCHVDIRAIQQVFVNLLDNAIKHSPENKQVSIELWLNHLETDDDLDRAHSSGYNVYVAFTDSGDGIPLQDQNKVFDAFYRSGSELRRETKGVGLGLSIVKHIVQAHDGSIDLVCPAEGGCRFIVSLPLIRDVPSTSIL